MRLETVGDVCEALDNAAATGDHKTPRIIASRLSQAALEVANPQARIYRSLAKAARHCANGIEARLAGEIDRAMASERLCDRALAEAQQPGRKNPRKKARYHEDEPSIEECILELEHDIRDVEAGGEHAPWLTREQALADLREQLRALREEPGRKNPRALREDWLEDARKAGRSEAAAFGASIDERRAYLEKAGWRNLSEADRQAMLQAWEEGVAEASGERSNPEWAKSLGRGLYKGARYAGESAADLYRGMREAHGEHDDVEQHDASHDEDAIPGDMTRENPEWARKLGRAAAAPRRAKQKLAESAAAKKKKAAEKAAAAKAAWASKKARARDYLDEVKRDLSEGFRSNPKGLKKPRKHPAFRTGRKPVGPRGSIRAFVFKEGDGFRAAVGIKMNGQEVEEILAESPKVLYSTMEEAIEVAEATADDFILNGIPFTGGKLKPEFVH